MDCTTMNSIRTKQDGPQFGWKRRPLSFQYNRTMCFIINNIRAIRRFYSRNYFKLIQYKCFIYNNNSVSKLNSRVQPLPGNLLRNCPLNLKFIQRYFFYK